MRRDDRVVIFMPNAVEVVIAIFAILKAGGTFVVVNATTKRGKLTYILNNCRVTAFVTTGRNAKLATALHAVVPSLQFTVLCGSEPTAGSENARLYA